MWSENPASLATGLRPGPRAVGNKLAPFKGPRWFLLETCPRPHRQIRAFKVRAQEPQSPHPPTLAGRSPPPACGNGADARGGFMDSISAEPRPPGRPARSARPGEPPPRTGLTPYAGLPIYYVSNCNRFETIRNSHTCPREEPDASWHPPDPRIYRIASLIIQVTDSLLMCLSTADHDLYR